MKRVKKALIIFFHSGKEIGLPDQLQVRVEFTRGDRHCFLFLRQSVTLHDFHYEQ